MKNSDTTRVVDLLTELSESINGPRQRETGHKTKRPLSDRIDELDKKVDKLDDRVSEVQLGLARLTADTKAQFKRVDKRFDLVDRSIQSTRVEIVDLVERVHDEVTGRVVDLEKPGPRGRGGGGSGSGGSGVPLAS